MYNPSALLRGPAPRELRTGCQIYALENGQFAPRGLSLNAHSPRLPGTPLSCLPRPSCWLTRRPPKPARPPPLAVRSGLASGRPDDRVSFRDALNRGFRRLEGRRSMTCLASAAEEGGLAGLPSRLGKLGERIETDLLPTDVRDRTMRAVDELGLRVTVGDVASQAGLKLGEAEEALKALAADANGFLEVTDSGDVLYCLPPNYRSELQSRSLSLKFEPALRKLRETGEYLLRVSFGTALLASIVLVYTTIIVVLTSSSSSSSSRDNDRRRGDSYSYGGGSFGFRPGVFFDLSDLLWYWDPNYYRMRRRRLEAGESMGFFSSVFSFVFGDGNPNESLEEERWRTIGALISEKGGVVTAEELAPYLDPPPLGPEARPGPEDEAFVLMVLQRFDGIPEVDQQGNLVYRFPALQRTAGSKSRQQGDRSVTSWFGGWAGDLRREEAEEVAAPVRRYLAEQQWKFSEAPGGMQALAIGLGVLNLVGVVAVSGMLRDANLVRQVGSDLVQFTASALPVLQSYAMAFFAIPTVRWLLLQRQNAKIEARNSARMTRALALDRPTAQLRRKLQNAREMAEQVVLGRDRVIYSTDKDLAGQDVEGQAWEQRLLEREREGNAS